MNEKEMIIKEIFSFSINELDKLNNYILENKIQARDIVYYISNIELNNNDAELLFKKIIEHWKNLNELLKRDCGLRVAFLDYLQNFEKVLGETFFLDEKDLWSIKLEKKFISLKIMKKLAEKEINRAKRYNLKISLLLLQISYSNKDNQIKLNEVMEEIIELISIFIRKEDFISLYKEDILLLFLPHTNKNGVNSLLKRIVIRLFDEYIDRIKDFKVLTGVSIFPNDGEEFDQLVLKAENSLQEFMIDKMSEISLFINEDELLKNIASYKERREFLRYKLNNLSTIEFYDENENLITTGKIENLSANGILIRCDCNVKNTIQFINRKTIIKLLNVGAENLSKYVLKGVVKRVFNLNEKNHVYIGIKLDQFIQPEVWEVIEEHGKLTPLKYK